jgi:glycerol kinase
MVHVAELNPARLEDTLMSSGPSLSLDGLFMKPTPATTPRVLPDGDDIFHPQLQHDDHLPQGIRETDEEKQHQWFVGSIDQGTTSSRFLIFNGEGDPVASHQIEFENLYPKSGYVVSDCSVLLE